MSLHVEMVHQKNLARCVCAQSCHITYYDRYDDISEGFRIGLGHFGFLWFLIFSDAFSKTAIFIKNSHVEHRL